jgi:hypothetical protein
MGKDTHTNSMVISLREEKLTNVGKRGHTARVTINFGTETGTKHYTLK